MEKVFFKTYLEIYLVELGSMGKKTAFSSACLSPEKRFRVGLLPTNEMVLADGSFLQVVLCLRATIYMTKEMGNQSNFR